MRGRRRRTEGGGQRGGGQKRGGQREAITISARHGRTVPFFGFN